ncbi:MAG: M14 family metallopeptidase [Lachnospiraceae bacterium]|nr:M14 family metallopeptidase [Lachnospiraceae bacterium]
MIETIVSVQLPVKEELKIKKNRLTPDEMTGKEKRICIVSGLYGDELGGQYICGEVIRRIKENYGMLKGIVDVYPTINSLGLDSRSREIPMFNLDYNTIFPGSVQGDLAEYTAAKLIEDIKGADFCIDVHSSNVFLKELPQIRVNDDVSEETLKLCRHLNMDFIWVHPSTMVNEGSLAFALNEIGVPTIVTESGTAFRIKYDYCEQVTDGIFCLMKELGIWMGDTIEPREAVVVEDNEITYLNCETSGLFVTHKHLYQTVEKGDVIGFITKPIFGSVEEEIIAPVSGILITLREHPGVSEGTLVARILGSQEEKN